jgi:hypothetical protein
MLELPLTTRLVPAVDWGYFERMFHPDVVTRIQDNLQAVYHKSPFIAYFIYASTDEEVVKFVRDNLFYLHEISYDNCYVLTHENPESMGVDWLDDMRKLLEPEVFNNLSSWWPSITPHYRDRSLEVAEELRILDKVPCVLVIESEAYPVAGTLKDVPSHLVRLPADADYWKQHNVTDMQKVFNRFFKQLFNAIGDAATQPPGKRLDAFKERWNLRYVFEWLPEEADPSVRAIQEWLAIPINITEPVFDHLIKPFLKITTL